MTIHKPGNFKTNPNLLATFPGALRLLGRWWEVCAIRSGTGRIHGVYEGIHVLLVRSILGGLLFVDVPDRRVVVGSGGVHASLPLCAGLATAVDFRAFPLRDGVYAGLLQLDVHGCVTGVFRLQIGKVCVRLGRSGLGEGTERATKQHGGGQDQRFLGLYIHGDSPWCRFNGLHYSKRSGRWQMRRKKTL
jgi:hypothetical protein